MTKPANPGGNASEPSLPFPDSLCHKCAAPPRYIKTDRSTFIHCPILKRYPPQPVWVCEKFVPKASSPPPPAGEGEGSPLA